MKFSEQLEEVSREDYNEKLNILPPIRWDADIFCMSEFWHDTITAIFARVGERHFCALRDIKKVSNADFYKECLEYIEKNPFKEGWKCEDKGCASIVVFSEDEDRDTDYFCVACQEFVNIIADFRKPCSKCDALAILPTSKGCEYCQD